MTRPRAARSKSSAPRRIDGWSRCAWCPKGSTFRAFPWACMQRRLRPRCSLRRRWAASCALARVERPRACFFPRSPFFSASQTRWRSSVTTSSTCAKKTSLTRRRASMRKRCARPIARRRRAVSLRAATKPSNQMPTLTASSSTVASTGPSRWRGARKSRRFWEFQACLSRSK